MCPNIAGNWSQRHRIVSRNDNQGLQAKIRGENMVRASSVFTLFKESPLMAQYVFTMNKVGKIVPPKRHILKDVSLSFFPGAKIGMLGVNGSGKSTLLKIMAGLDKEIEGEATPMPGLNIGYLPQ